MGAVGLGEGGTNRGLGPLDVDSQPESAYIDTYPDEELAIEAVEWEHLKVATGPSLRA